jgi:hypothetical protein
MAVEARLPEAAVTNLDLIDGLIRAALDTNYQPRKEKP